MKDIVIIVCAHKKYRMPEDSMYLPLYVGSQGKSIEGYNADDQGDNISVKNAYYSELTGLYWAWKNLKAEYIGLVHYRRHFSKAFIVPKDISRKFRAVLCYQEADQILDETDVILPKKRQYFIENLYSHYTHTMFADPLDMTGIIIREKWPEYYEEFIKLHTRTSAHMFNMFVMKKDLLNLYCSWLFDVLSELEKRVDKNQYDAFHARFFGRISELLLDVWINTNSIQYKEIKVIDMENVNWIKKGSAFLVAKFTGKKYSKSF